MSREYRSQLMPKGASRTTQQWMRRVDTQLVSAFGGRQHQKRLYASEVLRTHTLPTALTQDRDGNVLRIDSDVQRLPDGYPDMTVWLLATKALTLKTGAGLQLGGYDIPLAAGQMFGLKCDGVSWYPIHRGFMSGVPGACPLIVAGDCTNALQILSASGYENFRVDTVNSDIYIGASGQVLIATSKPLGGPELLYGLYYNKQGPFVIGPNTPLFHATPGTEQIIFGGNSTTEVQSNVFANSVKFKSIAYDVVTTATDLTLSATASNLYIGILTRPDVTITIDLPEIVSVLGGTGAKEGQMLIFKDEAALATSNNSGQFVVVLNPFGTQGVNVSGVVLGSYNMVSHDITLIARGTDWVLS